MRSKVSIIAVICFTFALCFTLFALVGCGANKSLYTGTWVLQDSNDETFDSDTLTLMDTLDVRVTLTLEDDGTGTLNYLGNNPNTVTWEAKSDTEGTLTLDDSQSTLTLEEDVLTMTDADGTYMEFVRSDEPEPSTAPEASSASEAPSASAASSDESQDAASSEAESADDSAGDEGEGEGEESES